jgi:hypothetical protein
LNRTFKIHKGGSLATVNFTGSDVFKKQASFEPLTKDRIVGIDTESLTVANKLETVLVPLRYHDEDKLIEALGNDRLLETVLDSLASKYSEPYECESDNKQRKRRNGGKRDGRRVTVNPAVLVFYNLPYDIGRLAAKHKLLLKAIASGADTYSVECGKYEIEVSRMIMGAGASFEWFVRCPSKNRITRLIGIDMVGYWKMSLAKTAKALGVSAKIEIDPIFYETPKELFSDKEWEEFKTYSLGDVQTTVEIYHATVDLLTKIDARVIRRNGVIPPSAPGASARVTFAKAFDAHPEIEEWKRYPAWCDQMGCDSYFGGRTFCKEPGIFTNMRVLDLKSAYPYAMSLLPDPVTVKTELVSRKEFDAKFLDRIRGKFGVLYIDGECTDSVYPCFRTHDTKNRRLQYVYGHFKNMPVTIPEIVVGIESGALKVDTVRKGAIMEGSNEKSFLNLAMTTFFTIKENKLFELALRNMAKLLANSGYGKLIEVQQTQFYLESQIMCPPYVDMYKIAEVISRLYVETPEENFDNVVAALIETSYKHKITCDDEECVGCGPEEIEDGPSIPLNRRMSAFKNYRCGQYFMPLYAAQVTGLTSASLGLMARLTQAVQGDTDSVHILPNSTIGVSRYYEIMRRSGYPTPESGIGSWADETENPSVESVCVRPKVYSHKFADGSYKQAKHGFAKWNSPKAEAAMQGSGTYEERARRREQILQAELHEALKTVLMGKSVNYETRKAPRKLREAIISGKEVGEFIQRKVEVSHVTDPNITMINGINHWNEYQRTN